MPALRAVPEKMRSPGRSTAFGDTGERVLSVSVVVVVICVAPRVFGGMLLGVFMRVPPRHWFDLLTSAAGASSRLSLGLRDRVIR
ncbi:hypothetical protein GCM10027421_33060 [Microbacterium shaanxiense]